MIYVVPVLVPVLLAPFLTGEDWGQTPLGGVVLVASLLMVSVGDRAGQQLRPRGPRHRGRPPAPQSGRSGIPDSPCSVFTPSTWCSSM